ncbi:MAG: hypothetical protein CSA23_01870 [Deltaproteobacteria bacterium]|nr:MAG: hypothetical protein CSA23_01870 [Deltaproteobacteria bacterium]
MVIHLNASANPGGTIGAALTNMDAVVQSTEEQLSPSMDHPIQTGGGNDESLLMITRNLEAFLFGCIRIWIPFP